MISVNWLTSVVYVPKAYMVQIQATPFEIRQLDINVFRKDLNILEASLEGIAYPVIHSYTPETLLSGINYARIVKIINGYTIEFEDGQYGVSLYGGNSNIFDVKVPNQVSLLGNNSAGLVNSESINDQSYIDAKVYINTVVGLTGVVYPAGTPTRPSNNYDDAYAIAQARNFDSFDLHSPLLSITNPQVLGGTHWTGKSPDVSVLGVSGQNTLGCTFQEMTLQGTFNGAIFATNCKVEGITNFSGSLRNCSLTGTITLDNTFAGIVSLVHCNSDTPGAIKPILDFNGVTSDVQIRGYIGSLVLRNITQNINVSFDGTSATLEIENNCTNGTISVGGLTKIINNTGGSLVVSDRTVDTIVAPRVWSEEIVGDINPDSAARQLELARAYAQIASTNI